jgi:hypothetical protein
MPSWRVTPIRQFRRAAQVVVIGGRVLSLPGNIRYVRSAQIVLGKRPKGHFGFDDTQIAALHVPSGNWRYSATVINKGSAGAAIVHLAFSVACSQATCNNTDMEKTNSEAGTESAGQSGDTQGLPDVAEAGPESVRELVEEGQSFEAEVIAGVENAPDPDVAEVHTKQVPEDDVPLEYLERD